MVIGVVGSTDKLNYEDLGSNCCEAKVTEQGLCSDCKEHCSEHYIQEVDVAVLDFANSGEVHIHRLEYDSESKDYDDLEECVDNFLHERYGNTSNLEYMWDQVNPIKVLDHRLK